MDKLLKIAIVSDAYFPQISGVATTIKATADELERRGHSVLIVAPKDFKYKVTAPRYPEIKLVLAPYRKLARILDEFQPDAIHVSVEGPLGMAARRYAKRRKIHFTTAYHTRFPEYMRITYHVPEWISYMVLRYFHNAADTVMVAAENLKLELEAHGIKNCSLWTRGVDHTVFSPENPAQLPHKKDGPIFMYMGRVAPEKNLEAFLSLNLPGKKYVVGDGPERTRLALEYPDTVFTGYKFGKELASYLAAADVFVFPSLTDTFGLVMLEANACGVPVATYPSQASHTVIRNNVNGIIHDDLREACLAALNLDRKKCREVATESGWEKPVDLFLSNIVLARN